MYSVELLDTVQCWSGYSPFVWIISPFKEKIPRSIYGPFVLFQWTPKPVPTLVVGGAYMSIYTVVGHSI